MDHRYEKAFNDGREDERRRMWGNYDQWLRAMEAKDMKRSTIFATADLAIRQVLTGDPLGKRPDGAEDA